MYLDPGFGSMVIQLLVASIAAAVAFIGIFRQKITAFFSKKKNKTIETDSEEKENGE